MWKTLFASFPARNFQKIAALGVSDDKFYVAASQRDFVNRLVVALAQFDTDLAAGWSDEAQHARGFCILDVPTQLRSEPTGKKKRSRFETGCEIDAQLTDSAEAMM